jgi:hypothetical protein
MNSCVNVGEGYGSVYGLHPSLRTGPEISTLGLHVRRSD